MAAQRQRRRQLQRPRRSAQRQMSWRRKGSGGGSFSGRGEAALRHGGAKAAAEAASAAEAERRKGGAKAAVPEQPRWFTVAAQEGATSKNDQGCGITYLSRNLADSDVSSAFFLVRCVQGPCAAGPWTQTLSGDRGRFHRPNP